MTPFTHDVDRRTFLQTFLVSAGGATALGALPIRAPAAWVQWDPPTPTLMLGDDPTPGLIPDETTEIAGGVALGDPAIARTPDGTVWVTWTEMDGDDERIYLRGLNPTTGDWIDAGTINDATLAYHPTVVAVDGALIVAWSERRERRQRIVTRRFDIGHDGAFVAVTPGEPQIVAESDVCWRPALAPSGEGALLAWEEKIGDHFVIRAARLEGGSAGEAFDLSDHAGRDCRRPTLATSPETGEIAFAYDVAEGGGTHSIIVGQLNGTRTQVTHHPATNIAPAIAHSLDGRLLWIGWHSNRAGDDTWDMPRWYRLAALDLATGALLAPPTPPRDMDLTKQEADQGFEFVRLVACPDGGVWVAGRPSHNWCVQKYHGGDWSPIYRLPIDQWGGRGKLASALLDADGALWVARRDIRANAITRIGGAVSDETRDPALVAFSDGPARPLANAEAPIRYPAETVDDSRAYEFYFGDIHGHSYMSDGMGDVEEHFLRTRDLHGDDFFALTDHDNFVGQRMLNSEYEEHRRAVEHFHQPGRFVTLCAQEWTTARSHSPNGYGHLIFYGAPNDHPMMDHLDERWDTQAKVTAIAKQHGLIAGPHHVGWTGYRWEETDAEVVKFVEMCSVHGVFEHEGNEPIPHRGNARGCFVQDGLARGMKFGFVGGSDQHGLIWHHRVSWKRHAYRAGLTGILAPELTRDAVMDAFSNRRTFATTGVKMRMGFKINDALMGSEITSDGPPRLHVDLIAPTDIRWIEIVRSNETIRRYGGESLHSFFSFTDEDCPIGEEVWYYLRILFEDGNMAWPSPIWVTRTA